MRHRHLDISENDWSIAGVESILERGSDADIISLLKVVRKDPYGPAAEAVLKAIPHLTVYGYPALFKRAIKEWRIAGDRGLGKGA
ncbi:MAG: hypothetical protein AB1512_20320 [Thermodesulfobacteriota bacterium]